MLKFSLREKDNMSSENAISTFNSIVKDGYILNKNKSLNRRKIVRHVSFKEAQERRTGSNSEEKKCVWIHYGDIVSFAEKLVDDIINEAEGK